MMCNKTKLFGYQETKLFGYQETKKGGVLHGERGRQIGPFAVQFLTSTKLIKVKSY